MRQNVFQSLARNNFLSKTLTLHLQNLSLRFSYKDFNLSQYNISRFCQIAFVIFDINTLLNQYITSVSGKYWKSQSNFFSQGNFKVVK